MRFATATRHRPPSHIGELLRQFRVSLNWSVEDLDKAIFHWGTLGLEQLEKGDPVWINKLSLAELTAFRKEFDVDIYAWYYSLTEPDPAIPTAQAVAAIGRKVQKLVATHGKGDRVYTSEEVRKAPLLISVLKEQRGVDIDVRQVEMVATNIRGEYKVRRMAIFENGEPVELCEICCGKKVTTEPVGGKVLQWIDEEGKERRNG